MQRTIPTPERRCQMYPYTRLSRVEHLHSRFEIVIPSGGIVKARLDGKAYTVSPGEMLVVFPGVPHGYEPSAVSEGVVLNFYAEMLSEMGDTLNEVQPAEPVVSLKAQNRDVRYCLERLEEMARSGQTNETLAQAYLTLMFIHLTPLLELEKSDPAASKELLYRAMQYISQNLASPLNIRSTARALGVNNYYLSHVLNERIHMGFRAYLNTLRIERARRYLRLTAWSVEEIAAACGFNTLRTFDRVFQEHCGCTPREFRKNNAIVRREKGGRT